MYRLSCDSLVLYDDADALALHDDATGHSDVPAIMDLAQAILLRLRYLSSQASMPHKTIALAEHRHADAPASCIDLESAEDSRNALVRDYALATPITLSHVQRLPELAEDFAIPIASDVLLEALSAHIDTDYRRSLLFAGIAVEAMASSTLTAAHDRARACRPPDPTLRVVTVSTPEGVRETDPIFDRLMKEKAFPRLLHECPLYILRRSLRNDDKGLYDRALKLYDTRNKIAHGLAPSSDGKTHSLDFRGSLAGLGTAIEVFRWFGDESPYTPWRGFVMVADPTKIAWEAP